MGGLLHVLAKGAGIIGQNLENAQNPQEVVQRQQDATQRKNAQQDQWKQLQQGLAQGVINNPKATPEQKVSALQRMAQVFGQAQTADQAAQLLQGYSSPEQVKGAEAEKLQGLKNQGAAEKSPGGRPVPFFKGAMDQKDAAERQESGFEFKDESGGKIDASQLNPNMILVPVYFGKSSYWTIADDQGRYVTADNQKKLEPAIGGPNPEAPSAGAARVPTSRTTTATSPSGKQVVTGTSIAAPVAPTSSRTPVAPGQGPGAPVPPGEPPNPKLHVRPQPGAPVSSKTPQPGKTKSILPDIQNMTPQNATRAAKAQPAVTALLGLYGDPEHPEVKSMADYASLASNPHAQKVLGVAFKMLDQDMGEITDPGVIATLMTAGGWQNFRANAEAQAQRQTGQAMTAEEKEYFDTAIASMADIIGSRAATGQSPARFSVKSIQNELPLIGTSSVTDPKSYLTKMGTIARQIEVGLNSMPDNARAMKYLQKRVNDLIQQSNQYSKKLNPGGVHQYAIDDSGKRRKVLDPNAKLPQGWKWAE